MTRVRNRVTQSQSVIILGLRLYLELKFVAINKIIITKILSIKINRRCIDVTAYNWAEVEIGFISKLWWHKNNELRSLISLLYCSIHSINMIAIFQFRRSVLRSLEVKYFWENRKNLPILKTFLTRDFSKFNSDFNCQFIWTF